VEYHHADKLSFKDLERTFPKELKPTNRTNQIFGGIFIFIIILGLLTSPWDKMLSGNVEGVKITAGYPWAFLILDLENAGNSPFIITALLFDLLIYLLLAYAIDVTINVFISDTSSFRRSKKTVKVFDSKNINSKNNP